VTDAEFLRSEFYADFGRSLGLRYVVGTVLLLGPAGTMAIGLHRPEQSGPFEARQGELIEQLMPHLRRAMQLRFRLAAGGSAVSPCFAALNALAAGVLVVDADLRVLVANIAAEAMAGPEGVIRLTRASGVARVGVTALSHSETAALLAVVRATALRGAAGGGISLRDADGTIAVAALVSPLPRRLASVAGELAGRVPGQALILLQSLRSPGSRPEPALLRDLFGLTQAEAEVALALSGGATKEAVADRRSSRVSTVRTQVRSILAKSGAANLRDLEGILGSLRGALSSAATDASPHRKC
jgi:DNA-binding NarL/FixJ family response regulator